MARLAKDQIMPLTFVRERDFRIFHDEAKNNFYALLPLLPKESVKARRVAQNDRLRRFGHPETGLKPGQKIAVLFPLGFGEWQETILNDHPHPKRAEVFRKPDGYYFNITLEVPEAERYEWETVLGIDLGLGDAAAWTVLDRQGRVLRQGIFSGKERLQGLRSHVERLRAAQRKGRGVKGLKVQRQLEELAHLLANDILALAKEHRAKVVLEDLLDIRVRSVALRRRLRWMVNGWNFRQLQTILIYKAQLRGVPKPFYVKAHYTSQICPRCPDENGEFFYSRDNRPGLGKAFKCVRCGYEAQANLNASENIARRALSIFDNQGAVTSHSGPGSLPKAAKRPAAAAV